jgi:hypothetical protein
VDSCGLRAGNVVEHMLPIAALPERRLRFRDVQLQLPRDGQQVLDRKLLAPAEQQLMRLPEFSVRRGEL